MSQSNKKFIIKYIIFVILLIIITGVGIYYSIQYLNKENTETEEPKETKEEIKPIAKDSKYGIQSYTETYNENSINIEVYYDIDGQIISKDDDIEWWSWDYKTNKEFIQIEGLKDKQIQDKINKKIKDKVYSLNCEYVNMQVTGNFANILSINIGASDNKGNYEDLSMNIDLTTGEDIPFEKVFVSSAPINSFLTEALFETLAWDKAWEEEGGGICDMDKVDTSTYEDKSLMLMREFKKKKDDIYYNIYPSQVIIWNLVSKEISETDYEQTLNISFLKHKEDIAIYKRYLTNTSIYENDNLGTKDIIIMTEDPDSDYCISITYGKIADNIFMEEVLYNDLDDDTKNEVIKSYIAGLSSEKKKELLSRYKSKAAFFQREYHVWESENGEYYELTVSSYQAECELSYFKEEAFGDYIKVKSTPVGDVSLNGFDEYMQEDYPNLEIAEGTYERFFISKTGEYLGTTEEEAISKTESIEQTEEIEVIDYEEEPTENIITNTTEVDNTINNENTIDNNIIENTVTNESVENESNENTSVSEGNNI